MSKSQEPEKKKGGRPRADTAAITLRLHKTMISAIDDYRRSQDDLPNRPEAIRLVLAEWLRAKGHIK